MSTGEAAGGGGAVIPAAPWPLEGFGQSVVLTEASEQRLQALRRALRRSDRFALFVVLATAAARGEVLRRLRAWSGQEGVPPLHFLPEGDQGAQAVEDLLETADRSRSFQGIVIPDAGALLDAKDGLAMQALNVARDTLAGIVPGPLILVLAPTRAAELPRAAPDLFDIRSGTCEVEAAPSLPLDGLGKLASRPWELRGPPRPVRETLDEIDRLRALMASAEPPPATALADAWLKLGWELLRSYMTVEALTAALEAQHLAERAGYQSGLATALLLEGEAAMHMDDLRVAKKHYQHALILYRSNQDRLGEIRCLNSLGDLALQVSDLDTARDAYRLALITSQDIRHRLGEANSMQGLGLLDLAAGQLGEAFRRFLWALERYREVQSQLGEHDVHGYLAQAAARAGALDQALVLADTSLELGRHVRDRFRQAIILELQLAIFRQQKNLTASIATAHSLQDLYVMLDDTESAEYYASIIRPAPELLQPEVWSELQRNPDAIRHAAIKTARERLHQAGRDPYDPPPAS